MKESHSPENEIVFFKHSTGTLHTINSILYMYIRYINSIPRYKNESLHICDIQSVPSPSSHLRKCLGIHLRSDATPPEGTS